MPNSGKFTEDPLSVEGLLQQVAALIDYKDLEPIRIRLRQEFIVGAWQLIYLDSSHWAALGAPLGFIAAVQHVLNSDKKTAGLRAFRKPRSMSSIPVSTTATDARSVFSTPISHPPDDEDDEDDADVESSSSVGAPYVASMMSPSPSPAPEKPITSTAAGEVASTMAGSRIGCCERSCAFFRMASLLDFVFPFNHRKIIHRCLLHGKTCAELRGFVYRKAEMYFFWSALCSGVFAELWGHYPIDDAIPDSLRFSFDLLCMLDLWLSFALTASNIVFISMSCCVELPRYKDFYNMSLGFVQVIEHLMIALVYSSLSTVFLLTLSKGLVVAERVTNKRLVWLSFCITCGSLSIFGYGLLLLYNELSRFSFHGGLFGKCFKLQAADIVDGSPKEKEVCFTRRVLQSLNRSTEHMIVEYANALDQQFPTKLGDVSMVHPTFTDRRSQRGFNGVHFVEESDTEVEVERSEYLEYMQKSSTARSDGKIAPAVQKMTHFKASL